MVIYKFEGTVHKNKLEDTNKIVRSHQSKKHRQLQYNAQKKGLWCIAPFITIFQLYRGWQFYLWRKSEYMEKTTDLSQVPDKFKKNH